MKPSYMYPDISSILHIYLFKRRYLNLVTTPVITSTLPPGQSGYPRVKPGDLVNPIFLQDKASVQLFPSRASYHSHSCMEPGRINPPGSIGWETGSLCHHCKGKKISISPGI